MKIVIQDRRSGCFVESPGKYTHIFEDALGFESLTIAREFCRTNQLQHHLVLARDSNGRFWDIPLGDCLEKD
jgi:hypothetical protein